MSTAELDAAGIHDARLRESYLRCRRLNAAHGRTYFLATRLLAPWQRPPVHALYGLARWIDDLVDEGTPDEHRSEALNDAATTLLDGLRTGTCDDPVISAVVDTARRFDIPTQRFTEFIDSMRMDLDVTDYPHREALNTYIRGSAETIGLQMLSVLDPRAHTDEAAACAASMGRAFQLTNFLRDVSEDLGRDRVYLPADELAAFGVDRELLTWCRHTRRTHPRVRRALAHQVAVTRAVYREAEPGIALLPTTSRPCMHTALKLYSEILDRIEADDYAVFAHRATVGRARRATVAAAGITRAWLSRTAQETRWARSPT